MPVDTRKPHGFKTTDHEDKVRHAIARGDFESARGRSSSDLDSTKARHRTPGAKKKKLRKQVKSRSELMKKIG